MRGLHLLGSFGPDPVLVGPYEYQSGYLLDFWMAFTWGICGRIISLEVFVH